ncbi:MAG: RNA polymerase factor sigma-54 [Pseudomonadota bacterium]
MSMRQRLDVRQSQSLVMTPQLQQAIKLLQLSNQELVEYVEEEIERNPLLQAGETSDAPNAETASDETPANDSLAFDGTSESAHEALDAPSEDVSAGDTGSDATSSGPSADTDWSKAASGPAPSDDMDFDRALTREKSLREHLSDQLQLAKLTPADTLIAARLIEETDEAGYCRADLDVVATALGTEIEDVEAVLTVCQGFEPAGVMARTIQECLAIQLSDRDRLDPVMALLLENLALVAKHDIPALMDACGVDREDVMDMISELRTLTPKPGAGFAGDAAQAVAPDVFVREMPNGAYAVELNSDTLPKVLMDRAYYAEVSALPMSNQEKDFISECAANASWLIKSLDQRARTILKVSGEIVRQQDAFFAHGVAHLRPLNLKQVADIIGMHESTVSRVTSNKYMATPRGMFELKYFFSASIPATGGGEAHSAEAVRHRIKMLIQQETPGAVLSDDQIVDTLREFGIDIARRTVAKYRESLNIPSSVQRRRMLKQSA